jgi:hypothetical protein
MRAARSPRLRAPLPVESEMQKAVAKLLDWSLAPGWRCTANAAGAWLSFDPEQAARIGRWLREQGVKPGWPDIQLVSPTGQFHGLELKRGKRGVMSDAQLAFQDHCRTFDWPYEVARSFDEAEAILRSWGALRAGRAAA